MQAVKTLMDENVNVWTWNSPQHLAPLILSEGKDVSECSGQGRPDSAVFFEHAYCSELKKRNRGLSELTRQTAGLSRVQEGLRLEAAGRQPEEKNKLQTWGGGGNVSSPLGPSPFGIFLKMLFSDELNLVSDKFLRGT